VCFRVCFRLCARVSVSCLAWCLVRAFVLMQIFKPRSTPGYGGPLARPRRDGGRRECDARRGLGSTQESVGGRGTRPPPESSREKTRLGSEPTPERCVSRAFCSLSAQERFVHGPGCTRTVLQSSKVDIPERSKGRQRTLRKMSRCKLLMGSSKSWWRSGGGFPGNEVLTGDL
jgi:hypothetical protein